MTPRYVYKAQCVRVIDVDTYEMNIDLGFGVSSVQQIELRGAKLKKGVSKVDGADRARDHLLPDPTEKRIVFIQTTWDKEFGKYVADVFLDDQGTDLAGVLVTEGFAQWT